jgi:hypothetical protein
MEKELIFMVGEAILLEVEGVKDVTYPQVENPYKLYMEFKNGTVTKLR